MQEDAQAIHCEMVAIDFECTGSVDGFLNTPWQIGLMPIREGRPVPEMGFTSLLRVPSEQPFNLYTPGRWAQKRDEISSAPTLAELWPTIGTMICGHPLVAHHTPTERGILRQFFPLQEFGPWIDTLTLCRKAYPQLVSFKLEDIIPNLGWQEELQALCPGLAPHDAFYDAAACGVFLSHLLTYPGWSIASVGQLSRL